MPMCMACGDLGEQCVKCASRDLPKEARVYFKDIVTTGEPTLHAILVTGLTVVNRSSRYPILVTSSSKEGLPNGAEIPPHGTVVLDDARWSEVWISGRAGIKVSLSVRGGMFIEPKEPPSRFDRSDVL